MRKPKTAGKPKTAKAAKGKRPSKGKQPTTARAGSSSPSRTPSASDEAPQTATIDVLRKVFDLARNGELPESDYVAVLAKITESGNHELAKALAQAWASKKPPVQPPV